MPLQDKKKTTATTITTTTTTSLSGLNCCCYNAQTALFKPCPYHAVNTFYFGYKNQSAYGVSGTSRCLF
jgi:hypothetical protein